MRARRPACTPNPASCPGPTEFGLIKEAWDTIHTQYVGKDTLDDRALIYGAIDGLTQAVGDTGHTDFMTPEERAARNDVAVRLLRRHRRPHRHDRRRPAARSSRSSRAARPRWPASRSATSSSPSTARRPPARPSTKSPPGSAARPARRSRSRQGRWHGPRARPRHRARRRPDRAVSWTIVPGTTTALVRLDQFSIRRRRRHRQDAQGRQGGGADRIVLDLRGNPGGYVNEAVGVASQFLTEGLVYIERNAAGDEDKHEVSPGGVATDMPLVVLVDGSTASSSEIVSGALQDAGRAKIMGETTYGTGTVLGEFDLSDGSALRVGTVEWLTPDGRRIWHEGIVPDVAVALPDGATRSVRTTSGT